MKRLDELNRTVIVAKMLGMFPFELTPDGAKIDYRLITYFILIRIAFAVESVIKVELALEIPGNTSPKRGMIKFAIFYTTTGAFYLCLLLKRRCFSKLSRYFFKADVLFKKLNRRPYYNFKLNMCWDCMVMGIMLYPCLSMTSYSSLGPFAVLTHPVSLFQWIYAVFLFSWLYLLVQPFTVIANNLKYRLVDLISILNDLKSGGSTQGVSEKLETTIQLFEVICSTCETLNSCFSVPLLFLTGLIFYNFVGFTSLVLHTVKLDSYFAYIQLPIIVNQLCVFLSMIPACSTIPDLVEEFNCLVYDMMVKDKTKIILNNSKLSLHILMQRKVVFTAHGFFTINNTLIHTMLASTTTYLITVMDLSSSGI